MNVAVVKLKARRVNSEHGRRDGAPSAAWGQIVSKSGSRDPSVRLGRRVDAQPDLRSWTSP